MIKDNNGKYGLRKEVDGYSIVNFETMQIIRKLDNNFEGETNDCFVKYDVKNDILHFDEKVKKITVGKYKDDYMKEDGFESLEDGTLNKIHSYSGGY